MDSNKILINFLHIFDAEFDAGQTSCAVKDSYNESDTL